MLQVEEMYFFDDGNGEGGKTCLEWHHQAEVIGLASRNISPSVLRDSERLEAGVRG